MTGILAVFNDLKGDRDAHLEFNNWYNQQHVLERVGVPGFVTGYRYKAVRASHEYFAWYETAWPSVMQSVAYVDRLEDPTAWTARVMPGFANMVRTVATRTARAGEGTGAAAATFQIVDPRNKPNDRSGDRSGDRSSDQGDDAPDESLVTRVLGCDGVISTENWLADKALSMTDTTESRLRKGQDQTFDRVLMVQAMDVESLDAVCTVVQSHLQRHGLKLLGEPGLWQLLFTAHRRA